MYLTPRAFLDSFEFTSDDLNTLRDIAHSVPGVYCFWGSGNNGKTTFVNMFEDTVRLDSTLQSFRLPETVSFYIIEDDKADYDWFAKVQQFWTKPSPLVILVNYKPPPHVSQVHFSKQWTTQSDALQGPMPGLHALILKEPKTT